MVSLQTGQGKQEELVEAMSAQHFSQQASVNEQASLLKAVEEVGLEPREAAEMLEFFAVHLC